MTRTRNSIKNIKFSMVGQILSLLLSFVSRSVFVSYLSAEYLGINGLFTNILSILSLAELGIGSAIVFSLYEPLAQRDEKRLKALMSIYKKAYISIGLWMMVSGILVMPFLKFFIKEMPDIPNIQVIYLMFVLNSALSYFFSYKRALIIADQKKYIDSIYHFVQQILLNIFQIIILVLTRNYLMFIAIKIIATFLENYLISIEANRMYPFLTQKHSEKLNHDDKTTIIKNIKAMFFHKIGTVIVTGTDNLLLSKFVGIVSVGIYSNYLLIINALEALYSVIFQAITASVGNLGALETKDRVGKIFENVDFIGFWIYSFSSIALFNLINPFINLWLGEQYTFSSDIVFIIVLNFYIQGLRKSVLTFKTALGLFWEDRYKPLFESVLNLVISIYLGFKLGVLGVLIGTTISTLMTTSWIEPYILYKFALAKSLKSYFVRYISRIFITIGIGIITLLFSGLIDGNTFISFIYKLFVCAVIPNVILFFVYRNSNEFEFLIRVLKESISSRRFNL